MKKIVNTSDMLFLLALDLWMVLGGSSRTTVIVVLTAPIILAMIYHACLIVVAPFSKSIPLVKQAGLAPEDFDPKVYWGRRVFELVWSVMCYFILLWQSAWLMSHRQHIIIVAATAFIVSLFIYPVYRRSLRR